MLKNVPVSTVLLVVLMLAGLGFAAAGFANAPNSQISPAFVSTLMLIGAACFAIAGVVGLGQKARAARFTGVAALFGTAYLIFMAIIYFQILSSLVSEF